MVVAGFEKVVQSLDEPAEEHNKVRSGTTARQFNLLLY